MNHSDLHSLFLTWSKTSNRKLGLLAYSFYLYSTTENWWLLSIEFLSNQRWPRKCILNLCASFAYRWKTEHNKARKAPAPNCSSLSAQLVVAFICKRYSCQQALGKLCRFTYQVLALNSTALVLIIFFHPEISISKTHHMCKVSRPSMQF